MAIRITIVRDARPMARVWRRRLTRRSVATTLLAVSVLAGVSAVAVASIPDSNGVIHG
jgi:hypothetical protein